MKEKNYTGAVPENYRGESITAESTREFEDAAAAGAFFKEAARQSLVDGLLQ